MDYDVIQLVAIVHGTRDTIIDSDRDDDATSKRTTRLGARAIEAVIAERILRQVQDVVTPLVARIGCAGDAIIDHRSGARLASDRGVADLVAVAKEGICANGVVGDVLHDTFYLATGVDRTTDGIIDHGGRPGLAVVNGVAELVTVAEKSVPACTVIHSMRDVVGLLVASIDRAPDPIACCGSDAGLTTVDRVAHFCTVTKLPIAAPRIVGRVHHHAEHLTALIDGAIDAVDHVWRSAGNTLLIDTSLGTVAVETVVTIIISDARWSGNAVF